MDCFFVVLAVFLYFCKFISPLTYLIFSWALRVQMLKVLKYVVDFEQLLAYTFDQALFYL